VQKLINRKLTASVLLIITFIGVGSIAVYLGGLNPDLSDVPPPENPPGNEREVVFEGDLELWAEADFWQDFMPLVPPEGAPFYTVVFINITNTGTSTLENFNAPMMTVYFNDSTDVLVTLNLTLGIQTFVPIVVQPGESIMVEYINNRNEVFSPTIDEGTGLYARVLFQWGVGEEAILTTVPSELVFTF
jgi:hypothetical protein